ncbi:calymmin [Dunckerocampus dactyliophorus]|uniref:calymmin n=1 Tax=Dunckerocampus dactyliophorus TaxID=161453 RepID=UPI0024059167|nr:calymmin [Dunckerocampus dactyliophorus]
MKGCLQLQSVLILWLVQCASTGGYGAGVSGVANGQAPHFDGRRPHNGGGVGRMLMPSKGVRSTMGAYNGYGGYPNKGVGYAATNGAVRGSGGRPQGGNPSALPNGGGAKHNGYGRLAGPTNQQPMKGNGYGAHAGAFGGQGNKGYGGAAAGTTLNGYGPAAAALSGNGARTNGYGATNGGPGNNGMGGTGGKPMKGYSRPYYGAGPGAGMGASQGQGVPQLARSQGKAYGNNGYGGQSFGGYNGGYGSARMGLGRWYGNGGTKGPKQGYGAAADVYNGQRGSPNGYGYPNDRANQPSKPGYGNIPNGNGVKPNGYGATRGGYGNGAVPNGGTPNGFGAGGVKGYGAKPNGSGFGNAAALGSGNKLNGYGGLGASSNPQRTKGVGAVSPGQGYGGPGAQLPKAANSGYGQMLYGKAPKLPGAPNGKGLKGDVLLPQQPSSASQEGASQRLIIGGDVLRAPEPTSGGLVLVTQDQYQRLPSPVPQGKSYKRLMPQGIPEPVPVFPQGKEGKLGGEPTPGSAFLGLQDKSLKAGAPAGGYIPAVEPPAALPQGTPVVHVPLEEEVKNLEPEARPDKLGVKSVPSGEIGSIENGGVLNAKGQGAKATKPDCGPGGASGQWMKIPRPGYNAGAGASSGTNTKGYGAGSGIPNRFGVKPNVYRQGAYLGGAGYGERISHAGHGDSGNSNSGFPKGYGAGVQPDYASLGHGVPSAELKSGGGMQVPYNGSPAVPAGLDGASQPQPQSAGLGPNEKQGLIHGGMDGLPYGAQTGMGTKKANTKYGIGGLQFGGNPLAGNNGGGNYGYGIYGPAAVDVKAGKYGGAGTGGLPVAGQYGYGGIPNLLGFGSNGQFAGKYGHGRTPHEAQPVGFGPQVKPPGTGKYGPAGSTYQSGPLGFAPSVNYDGGDGSYVPQGVGLGGEGKPAEKYDNQGSPMSQPLESASESKSVEGVPTLSRAGEGKGMATNKFENVGYISGSKLQPEVASLPAAPTPGPALSALTPGGADDLSSDLTGNGGLIYNSAGAGPNPARGSEQPDDAEQLPRQIQIQQHLKLHFHPQGSKNANHDLNGFFGNSGYKG